MNKAEVTLPSDTEVVVTRKFAAPVAKLWRAYTDPKILQKWLNGAEGWVMTECEMDVRVGGSYRWQWENPEDGTYFGFTGQFREVEPDRRLVNTEVFDPGTVGGTMGAESIVTVTFEEVPEGALLTSRIVYQSLADRDAALSTGMTDGMESTYANLDALLAGEAV